jgi:hypothetical protein
MSGRSWLRRWVTCSASRAEDCYGGGGEDRLGFFPSTAGPPEPPITVRRDPQQPVAHHRSREDEQNVVDVDAPVRENEDPENELCKLEPEGEPEPKTQHAARRGGLVREKERKAEAERQAKQEITIYLLASNIEATGEQARHPVDIHVPAARAPG